MKRTKALRLVLLGGGVAAMLAACGESQQRQCERARAELNKDAEAICRRSTQTNRSGHGGWFFGRSGSAASGNTASAVRSARSGFGSSGSHFSGGG